MSRRYLAKSLSSGLCHQWGDIVGLSNGARSDDENAHIRTQHLLYIHFYFKRVTGVVANSQHSSFDEHKDFVLTLGQYKKSACAT